jgi:hypothetical protein
MGLSSPDRREEVRSEYIRAKLRGKIKDPFELIHHVILFRSLFGDETHRHRGLQ